MGTFYLYLPYINWIKCKMLIQSQFLYYTVVSVCITIYIGGCYNIKSGKYCRVILNKYIFLQICFIFLVPPDILDYPTSSDMVVHEGSNVTLQCAATGYPSPTITWRREDNHNIVISNTLTGKFRLYCLNVEPEHVGTYFVIM